MIFFACKFSRGFILPVFPLSPLGRDYVNSWKNVLKNIFFTEGSKIPGLLRDQKEVNLAESVEITTQEITLWSFIFQAHLSFVRTKESLKQEFLTCDENNDDNDNGKTDYLR